MKLNSKILAIGFVMAAMTNAAEARRGAIAYSYGPYVTEIKTFTGSLAEELGPGYKLGWRHERFSIFGIPFWGTTDGSYVLYTEAGDGWRMVPVPPEYLHSLGREINMNLNGSSPVSLFSLYWGWIIAGPLILLAFMRRGGQKPQQRSYRIDSDNLDDAAIDEMIRNAKVHNSRPAAPNPNSAGHAAAAFGKRTN